MSKESYFTRYFKKGVENSQIHKHFSSFDKLSKAVEDKYWMYTFNGQKVYVDPNSLYLVNGTTIAGKFLIDMLLADHGH